MAWQVGHFALAGLVALVVVGLATSTASRRAGEREAIIDARNTTSLKAQGIVGPLVTDALLEGDQAAIARIDGVVRRHVLDDLLVRVKLWTPDGRIVYADEAGLVGTTWTLDPEQRSALASGRIMAEVSTVSRAENRLERPYGKLLEVYVPVRTSGGVDLLFEAYYRYDVVSANGARLWRSFAPVALGALILLQLVQVPLAWSLARRLRQRGHEREALLRRTLEASEVERRQIASDLHDGVVQDMTGVALSLSAAARRGSATARELEVLNGASESIRGSIKALRSLVVDIYPPDLAQVTLDSALSDLLSRADDHGVQTSLDCSALRDPVPDPVAKLLYRAAQEGLRNALAHGRPTSVRLVLSYVGEDASIEVVDDGRGIDGAEVAAREAEGHMGLRALRGLLVDAGGALDITAVSGGGTRLRAKVPVW